MLSCSFGYLTSVVALLQIANYRRSAFCQKVSPTVCGIGESVQAQGEWSLSTFEVREVNAVRSDRAGGDVVSHVSTVVLMSATGVTKTNVYNGRRPP